MKTPEEILEQHLPTPEGHPDTERIIEAMKEFGRQAWVKCASTYESVSRMEAKESRMYAHYLKEAYLNQIAKESQERGNIKTPSKIWTMILKMSSGSF